MQRVKLLFRIGQWHSPDLTAYLQRTSPFARAVAEVVSHAARPLWSAPAESRTCGNGALDARRACPEQLSLSRGLGKAVSRFACHRTPRAGASPHHAKCTHHAKASGLMR